MPALVRAAALRAALRFPVVVASLFVLATPLAAQRGAGRLGLGPFVGSGPGAAPLGPQVPTVGVAGDLALLRAGRVGLHVGGTYEHRAGARMTGVVGSAVVALHHRLALRVGASAGGAEVQRQPWVNALGWRDWRGVDAGLELRLGRTTGALVLRQGTMDAFAPGCPPEADCLVLPGRAPATRFTRVSVESRYAFF